MFARYLVLLLVGCMHLNAIAEVVVDDHFDDGVLDPAWDVVFNEFACGWTHAEEASELHVSEICHDGSALDWAIVSLFRPCVVPSDFSVVWTFDWHTPYGLPDTMQALYFVMYDDTGAAIAYVGFNDCWALYQGERVAWVRGTDGYHSGANSLLGSDNATVIVYRVGEVITFKWNGDVIFEAPESTPVASISIRFYYTYYGGTSTNIDESVDLLWISDSVVTAAPMPALAEVQLAECYPNPFNPLTTISFAISTASHARLQIVDLRGRLVATLIDEQILAGQHAVRWNGRDDAGREMPSGIYISRLVAGGQVAHGRMTLAR
jgi:hypothetical protein